MHKARIVSILLLILTLLAGGVAFMSRSEWMKVMTIPILLFFALLFAASAITKSGRITWEAKFVPILLWIATSLAACLVLLGVCSSDPEAAIMVTGIGSMPFCFFASLLAAYYARPYPWQASLLLTLVLIGDLYANVHGAQMGETRYTHLTDYVSLLFFSVPGTLALVYRGIKGQNDRRFPSVTKRP